MPRDKVVHSYEVEQYVHADKTRLNNPEIGLVNPDKEQSGNKKEYKFDPHLDPELQWAGKVERPSFEVPTVSLHVHERIDPKTIIESVKKEVEDEQPSLFATEKKPLRQAVEFYKHENRWSNRLVAGDSQASFDKWRYAVAYQREEIDDILEKGLWDGGESKYVYSLHG